MIFEDAEYFYQFTVNSLWCLKLKILMILKTEALLWTPKSLEAENFNTKKNSSQKTRNDFRKF